MIKFSKLFFLCLLLTIGITACTDDEGTPEPTVKTETEETEETKEEEEEEEEEEEDTLKASEQLDVKYGTDVKQKFDIYLPANRTVDTKVIILVHGGGWIQGSKEDMNPIKDKALADLPNHAIVNMNYRLASQGVSPFPMQLEDITDLINHLKDNQNEYMISQDFGFVGTSAGAHLSMLWSYDYDLENDINMVASIVGPTNLADPNYKTTLGGFNFTIAQAMQYFGEDPNEEFLKNYSPLYKATSTSPPTILFYAGKDELIPTTQGTEIEAKLTELGVDHEYTFYDDASHDYSADTAKLNDTWSKTLEFIKTYL